MSLSQKQAVELVINYLAKIETEALPKRLESIKEYFKTATPRDCLPPGSYYSTEDYHSHNYWFFPDTKSACSPLHTGGDSNYIAIHKETGEVSTVTVRGE